MLAEQEGLKAAFGDRDGFTWTRRPLSLHGEVLK
jgi:hypothetical protein